MKIIFLLLFISCSQVSYLDKIVTQKTLRVGTTGDYPPFSFYNSETQQYEGIDIELAQNLAKTLDAKIEWVKTSWPSLMEDYRKNKFDLAIGGISKKLSRQREALFSEGYYIDGKGAIALCTQKDKFSSLDKIDQTEVKIVVNPGGTNQQFVKENIHQAQVITHLDNKTIFQEIVAGQADVMITDAVEILYQIKMNPSLCITMPALKNTMSEKAIMISRDLILKEYVNTWLSQIKINGELQVSLDKYLK